MKIGELINKWDLLDEEEQNVGKFNEFFPNAKLGQWVPTFDGIDEFEEYPHHWKVEIGEITLEDKRLIKIEGMKTIVHNMRQQYQKKGVKKGRFKPVIVDGKPFEGVLSAARSFMMSIDQFHSKFVQIQKGVYAKKSNRANTPTTMGTAKDE